MNYELLAMVDLSALAGLLVMSADQLYPLTPMFNHGLYLGAAVFALAATYLCYDSFGDIQTMWRTNLPVETPWWLISLVLAPASAILPFGVTLKLIDWDTRR